MKKIVWTLCLLLSAWSVTLCAAEKVRFVLYTDLHQDLIPGRPQALREIVRVA